jgi:hypothetical protein
MFLKKIIFLFMLIFICFFLYFAFKQIIIVKLKLLLCFYYIIACFFIYLIFINKNILCFFYRKYIIFLNKEIFFFSNIYVNPRFFDICFIISLYLIIFFFFFISFFIFASCLNNGLNCYHLEDFHLIDYLKSRGFYLNLEENYK